MSPCDDTAVLSLGETLPIFHYFQKHFHVGWDRSINEDKQCNQFGIKHLVAFLSLRMHTENFNRTGGDAENFPATFLSTFVLFVSTTRTVSYTRNILENPYVNIEGKFFDESYIFFVETGLVKK